MDIWERMLPKINKEANEEDCWIWEGWNSGNGYGKVKVDGKACMAHRVAYSILVGPVPPFHVLDHRKEVCTSRACINPLHMEPVTVKENTARGGAILFGDIPFTD